MVIFKNFSIHLTFSEKIIHTFMQPIALPWFSIFINIPKYNYPELQRIEKPTCFLGILWAAPKKKVSHSKKRMRQATKSLKDIHHLNLCPACGRKKLSHTLCLFCFKEIKEFIKNQRK
ncbi:hypothetical protein PCANB_000380 [Pneumocystis canis]|nr:hypothetical protein PCANB_000380 [Pneumocystis canis]